MDRKQPKPSHSGQPSQQLVDSIIDGFIDDAIAKGKPDIEAACARHPEYADQIQLAAKSLKLLVAMKAQDSADQTSHLRLSIESQLQSKSSQRPSNATQCSEKKPDIPNEVVIPGNRYRIRELLGEGGFGVVYVAEQLEPVRRKVAIKVVKPGMDSKEVLARFEGERQALAMMDHPNIAKVLDGGATQDGRPYFVMELIRGIAITDFCDHEKMQLTQRLKLFRDVCLAVQHAHIKGIIHRDIKPSNVLVTMNDDVPAVKVIDFGVAKALHCRLADDTIYTAFGQMVGTPLYMSPEQIQLSELDVDTRSDVYSLGVLLFELITGETPFTKKYLVTNGIHAFRQIVCETEPPRPSYRLSTLRASNDPTVVDQRRYDGRDLKCLSGELDWIVMKALEKNRQKRYQSCWDFAADLDNLLRGDAVQAKPPTWLYRLSKVARKHKLSLAAGSAILATLLIGFWATYSQMRRAVTAEKEALEALTQSDTQRALAEKRLVFAEMAVDDMYVGVANKWIASQSNMTAQQRDFLQKAADIYRQLAAETSVVGAQQQIKRAKSLRRVASIEVSLGEIEKSRETNGEAIAILTKALSENEDDLPTQLLLVEAYYTLATSYLASGDRNSGLENLDKAADLILKNEGNEDDPDLLFELSRNARNLASRLGTIRDRIDVTRKLIELSQQVARDLLQRDPNNPKYKARVASALETQGVSFMWWGNENAEAIDAFEKSIALFDELVAEDQDNLNYLRSLQTCTFNLASMMGRIEANDKKDEYTARGLEISRRLAIRQPDQIRPQEYLTFALRRQANASMESKRFTKAQELMQECYAVSKMMANTFPENVESSLAVTQSLRDFASLKIAQDKLEEAANYFDQLILESSVLRTQFPQEWRLLKYQISASCYAAWAHAESKHINRAIESLDGLEDVLADYHQLFTESHVEKSDDAYIAIVPMCMLGLKALEIAESQLATQPNQENLEQLESRLQQQKQSLTEQAEYWIGHWIEFVLNQDPMMPSVLQYSEAFAPPADFFYDEFQSSSFNHVADSSTTIAINRMLQELALAIANSSDKHRSDLAGLLFVLSSAPEFLSDASVAKRLLAELVDHDQPTTIMRQAQAWALYRVGDYPASDGILRLDEHAEEPDNYFLRSLLASQRDEAEAARSLYDAGTTWLDANATEIRARRDSSDSHLTPHQAALQRLQHEAMLQLDSERQD